MQNEPKEKKKALFNKLKESGKELRKKSGEIIWDYRIEIFAGALLLVGLILAFFYVHIGGVLVGVGFGVCFFEEIHAYFAKLRNLYTTHGIFKSLILVASILYLLIAIPAFIIAGAIGYAGMYLTDRVINRS